MKILICNVGSTSLKYKLFDMDANGGNTFPAAEKVLATGKAERVGTEKSVFQHNSGALTQEHFPTHREAIMKMMESLLADTITSMDEIACVGFKVVHAKGVTGVQYLTEDVLSAMADFNSVAPAHNPPYIAAIRQFRELMPKTPLIGSFETGFHATMPPEAYLYSIPVELSKKYALRRYGFHGASHEYVTGFVSADMKNENIRLVSCHLGGSGSLAAVKNGKCMDTTLGLSLQCGVMHNNRIGDIDPYVLVYMMRDLGMDLDEVCKTLEKKSGFLGMSGVSGDLRDVELAAEEGNEDAKNAIASYAYSIKKTIGSYAAAMNGLDAIAFAGGIGENSSSVRSAALKDMEYLGIKIDEEKNKASIPNSLISTGDSKVKVYIVATNEEIIVARKAAALLAQK
ncbi:MAG: acetate/propionate family kinase [Christensenellaceae bacterium]|nr:acetate/propionate family kinase [Christensenellaceae bacterium]